MTSRNTKVAFVVAMDQAGTIGKGGGLPWHLPNDLKRFRDLTRGETVVMGRTTYESIGKPLAGRRNIVLSRKQTTPPGHYELARSLNDVFDLTAGNSWIYIIGGAEIYAAFEPYVDIIYATIVETTIAGDTVFPAISHDMRKEIIEKHPADERHEAPMRFETWTRRYAIDDRRTGAAETLGATGAV